MIKNMIKYRGNNIYLNKDKKAWVFSDNDEPIKGYDNSHPCGNCGKYYTEEGHDGCLGTLPGVMNACCGHGEIEECYIQFLDGECIRGEDAMAILNILKKHIQKEGD